MGGVQETLFDKDQLGEQGSPKIQYSSRWASLFKVCVPHREKNFVGISEVRRRKENEL
jgi:hypothetical protein